MNRHRWTLIPLAVAGLLAACSSTTPGQSPEATGAPRQTTPVAQASASRPTQSPSASAAPSATGHDASAHHETVAVEISNFAFSPAQITVRPGTEVVFTNLDPAPHTVTAGSDAAPMPELFDSGLLGQGESFSYVFEQAGAFAYFCERHPPMEATVTVEE